MKTTTFTLESRRIEVKTIGKGSTTVLFFHGFGSSAAALPTDERLLTQYDVQLLCINRPGVGGSDLLDTYTIATVAGDAKYILNQLGIMQCVVTGWSAGGLFAQAFAQLFPETVLSLHLVSSAIPFGKRDAGKTLPGRWKSIRFMNHYFPFAAKVLFRSVSRRAQKYPEGLMQHAISEMAAADQAVARDKRFYPLLQQAAKEGFGNEGKAVFAEVNALNKALIDYGKIACPVHIWTGGQDTIWPPATATYLQERLPQSVLHLHRHSGHLLYLQQWEKLLAGFALQPA